MNHKRLFRLQESSLAPLPSPSFPMLPSPITTHSQQARRWTGILRDFLWMSLASLLCSSIWTREPHHGLLHVLQSQRSFSVPTIHQGLSALSVHWNRLVSHVSHARASGNYTRAPTVVGPAVLFSKAILNLILSHPELRGAPLKIPMCLSILLHLSWYGQAAISKLIFNDS